MQPKEHEKKRDFSMFTTMELQETIAKHESMLGYLSEEHIAQVTHWINQGKEELTMRLIAGDDYATNRPNEQGN